MRYAVGPDDAGGWQVWQINSTDRPLGSYTSRAEAVRAAVDAAHTAGKSNPEGAQVLVQSRVNQFRIEWTYGDAYPRRA
jgi:hypothetical protein